MLALLKITFICITLFSQSIADLFTNKYSNWPSLYLTRVQGPKEQFERSEYGNEIETNGGTILKVFRPSLIEDKTSNTKNRLDKYKGAKKWQHLATLNNWPYIYLNKSKIANYSEQETNYKTNTNEVLEVEKDFVSDSRKSKCCEKPKCELLDQLQCFPESGKAKAPFILPEPKFDPDYEHALNGKIAEKITSEIFKIILDNKFLSDELGISMDDMTEFQNIMFREPWERSQNCCKFIDSDLKCFLSWIADCDTRD